MAFHSYKQYVLPSPPEVHRVKFQTITIKRKLMRPSRRKPRLTFAEESRPKTLNGCAGLLTVVSAPDIDPAT
jgi:hypothetical protein